MKLYFTLNLFNIAKDSNILYGFQYYFKGDFIFAFILGLFASTPIFKVIGSKVFKNEITYILKDILLIILFVISVSFIVSGSYSPFIYFQF